MEKRTILCLLALSLILSLTTVSACLNCYTGYSTGYATSYPSYSYQTYSDYPSYSSKHSTVYGRSSYVTPNIKRPILHGVLLNVFASSPGYHYSYSYTPYTRYSYSANSYSYNSPYRTSYSYSSSYNRYPSYSYSYGGGFSNPSYSGGYYGYY
jgi:hypothetical protein